MIQMFITLSLVTFSIHSAPIHSTHMLSSITLSAIASEGAIPGNTTANSISRRSTAAQNTESFDKNGHSSGKNAASARSKNPFIRWIDVLLSFFDPHGHRARNSSGAPGSEPNPDNPLPISDPGGNQTNPNGDDPPPSSGGG